MPETTEENVSEYPLDDTHEAEVHKDQLLESTKEAAVSFVSKPELKRFKLASPRVIALLDSTLKFFQTLARHQATRGIDLTWTPQEYYAEQQTFLTNRQLVGRLKNQNIQIADIKELFSNLMALQQFMRECQSRSAVTRLNTRTVVALDGMAALAEVMELWENNKPTYWPRLKAYFSTVTYEEIPHMNYIPSISWFERELCLGVGGFGSVYRCKFADGSIVGLKLVSRGRISKLDQIICGIILGSLISHPLVLATSAFFTTDKSHVYVTEFLNGIDLGKIIRQCRRLSVPLIRVISAQTCLAVNFLHMRGVIHRDVKLSNLILLPECRVKLLDFDTCKFCLGNFSFAEDFGTYTRISSKEFRDNRMPGTTIFTAPEVLKKKAYGRSLDWWSVGVSMMQMFTNRFPFKAKGRLGAGGLKTIQSHEFFNNFDWALWQSGKGSMELEILYSILERNEQLLKGIEERAKNRIVKLEDQTMIKPQDALLTWTSATFRASYQIAAEKRNGPSEAPSERQNLPWNFKL